MDVTFQNEKLCKYNYKIKPGLGIKSHGIELAN